MSSGNRQGRVMPKDLPPVIRLHTDVYGYLTRYRVISEDRNRFSAWSPVIDVPVYNLENLPSQVQLDINVSGNTISAVWGDEEERPSYDIFVSEDGQPFVYHGTSPIHTYSFLNKNNASLISVAIQVESINKTRESVLTIAEETATIEIEGA
jgi:hypothetical protein